MTPRDSTKPLIETGDRLMDLFWKTKPRAFSDEWRARFEHHVSNVMRVRSVPRLEAEIAAFENTVIEFLNATHPDTDSSRCAHCGQPETPDSILRPIGAGARHAWLHSDCLALWREQRRAEAIAALAEAEVAAKVPVPVPVPVPVSVRQENVRHPAPDYGLAYRERIRLAGDDGRKEEVQLRALEAVVNLYRSLHPGVDFESAKAAVLADIKQSSTKETA